MEEQDENLEKELDVDKSLEKNDSEDEKNVPKKNKKSKKNRKESSEPDDNLENEKKEKIKTKKMKKDEINIHVDSINKDHSDNGSIKSRNESEDFENDWF